MVIICFDQFVSTILTTLTRPCGHPGQGGQGGHPSSGFLDNGRFQEIVSSDRID